MSRTRSEAPVIGDLRHVLAQWDGSPARVVLVSVLRAPLYPSVRVTYWTRLAMWLWRHRLKPLALWCKSRAIRTTGAEIHPAATIGAGFALVHTVGVVVGHEVVAGRDLVLYQGVTLGHGGSGAGQPRLGDGVRIGAGASVLGPVAVGDGAVIGAGAVVLGDVPAGTTVVGVWKGARP